MVEPRCTIVRRCNPARSSASRLQRLVSDNARQAVLILGLAALHRRDGLVQLRDGLKGLKAQHLVAPRDALDRREDDGRAARRNLLEGGHLVKGDGARLHLRG